MIIGDGGGYEPPLITGGGGGVAHIIGRRS